MHQQDMKKGDILLTTQSAIGSSVIRSATLSIFSHSGIYDGEGNIIEAVSSGVRSEKISKVIQYYSLIEVYRHSGIGLTHADLIVKFAKSKIGAKYDSLGAYGSGINHLPGQMTLAPTLLAMEAIHRINPDKNFYCSELVARAYEFACAPIAKDSRSVTPQQLSVAQDVFKVGRYHSAYTTSGGGGSW